MISGINFDELNEKFQRLRSILRYQFLATHKLFNNKLFPTILMKYYC